MGVTDLGFGRYCPRLNVLRRLGSAARNPVSAPVPPISIPAELRAEAVTNKQEQQRAVYHLFCALRELKRSALCTLRDGADPVQWAAAHNLPSIPVIRYPRRLHAHWREQPRSGESLDIVFLPSISASYREYSAAERRWIAAAKSNPEPWFLPMPDAEILR
jgi:hypothetical protein